MDRHFSARLCKAVANVVASLIEMGCCSCIQSSGSELALPEEELELAKREAQHPLAKWPVAELCARFPVQLEFLSEEKFAEIWAGLGLPTDSPDFHSFVQSLQQGRPRLSRRLAALACGMLSGDAPSKKAKEFLKLYANDSPTAEELALLFQDMLYVATTSLPILCGSDSSSYLADLKLAQASLVPSLLSAGDFEATLEKLSSGHGARLRKVVRALRCRP